MDAIECIKTRFSVRKYKPEPVPDEILNTVITTAMRSPSYKNTQPWEVIVLSGAIKDKVSTALIGALESGAPSTPDIPHPASWPTENQARIDELYRKRNINTTDPDLAKRGKIANFNFYGAPHGIYLLHDSSLGGWSIMDMGMFAQSIMLSAHAMGLGTVPQGFLTDYASVVKETLGIPASRRLCLGISIGYPDLAHPANQFRTERVPMSEIVRWMQ